jgi:Fe2+ transport system protein FeoA
MILNNTAFARPENGMTASARLPTANPQLALPEGAVAALPLSELRGRQARVVSVSAEADDALRLMALGICAGRRVELVKAGDPLVVRVVGARVGLSARLAAQVVVAVDDQVASATSAA